MQYVAFLLGINLGKRSIKMADLKALMGKLGYKNAATVVASGNVIFDASKQNPDTLSKKLEVAYEKKFGFKVGVIVRTMPEIEKIIRLDPFKKIKMTKDIRRYVTFLGEKPPTTAKVKSPSAAYRVLLVKDREVYSVLDLSKVAKTPDVMKLLGQAFGKPARPGKQTMRNWNTVEKIARLA